MNYTTVADLKADALFRAGEPTDGTSDYDTKVLEYLNAAQLGLLLGGPFGPGDEKAIALPVVDWWWARKHPAGVFNTEGYVTGGTVAASKGSTTITFSVAPANSVAGWRIRIAAYAPVPRIASHTGGVADATLDAAWTEENETAASFKLFKNEYPLAADFLRFCGQLILPVAPYRVDVVDRDILETYFPISQIQGFTTGQTLTAALVAPGTVQLSHYMSTPLRIEYPYICVPADLGAGDTPILPRHYRRVLSVVAAAWLCFDKADNKTDALVLEAKVLLRGMMQEHTHQLGRASQDFGRIKARGSNRYQENLLRTEGGLIIGYGGGAYGY